jgi:hypothetical protein
VFRPDLQIHVPLMNPANIQTRTVDTLATATALNAAGLSTIRIKVDGSKTPKGKWGAYGPGIKDQHGKVITAACLPTSQELTSWFRSNQFAIGVAHGRVSGNSELLDFDKDAQTTFPAWIWLVEKLMPGLHAKLTIIGTPRSEHSRHVVYRCTAVIIPGNTKVAEQPAVDADGKPILDEHGKQKTECLIESRGEGGYAIVPGGPPQVHEEWKKSGRTYRHIGGPPLTELVDIIAEEREILWNAAHSLDRCAEPADSERKARAAHNGQLLPGDAYNQSPAAAQEVDDLLLRHGWTLTGQSGKAKLWRRPNKDKGHSATTGICTSKTGIPLFYNFSSNGYPFEAQKSYSPFAVFTFLEHGGDFRAGARALATKGYGSHRPVEQKSGPASGGPTDAPAAAAAHNPTKYQTGEVWLIPGPPHKTSARLTVPLTVEKAGVIIDTRRLCDANKPRKETARRILTHTPTTSEADIDLVLGRILAAAYAQANQPTPRPNDKTILDLCQERIPPLYELEYRTTRGAWSKTRNEEITRANFVEFFPAWFQDICATAADAPPLKGGSVDVVALQNRMRCCLRTTWDTIHETLAHDADHRFKNAVAQNWQKITTGFSTNEGGGEPVPHRASLAGLVRHLTGPRKHDGKRYAPKKGWIKPNPSFAAWYRVEDNGDIRLAMTAALAVSTGVPLPGTDSKDRNVFAVLADKYGIRDSDPQISSRLPKGGTRLVVLTKEFSDELLGIYEENWETETETR